MSQYAQVLDLTFPAVGALTGKKWLFANLTTGKVDVAGAGEPVVGIIQDEPDAADKATALRVLGTSKLVVDGSGTAITTGARLKSDTNGKGVVAGTTKDEYGAIALEASSASGDVIEVLLERGTLNV